VNHVSRPEPGATECRLPSRNVRYAAKRVHVEQYTGSRPASPLTADEIITTHARTSFSFAARFLPAPQRADAINLYAFFRTLDDLVDENPRVTGTTDVVSELNEWQNWLDGTRRDLGPREPLATNLARVIERHQIPVEVFHQMLDGLRSDLTPREITTDAELQQYCYRVASTVGYAMAHVLGATSPQALAAAERLGAAMQLTNILRDIGEDLDAGRIYLPTSLLTQHGLCRGDLRKMQLCPDGPDARFSDMMRGQIHYARELYAQAIPGIWLLPERCRFPILVAARLYQRLLTIVEQQQYDTLRRRAATTRRDKAQEALTCWVTLTFRRPSAGATITQPAAYSSGSTVEIRSD
jgi:15-cis-phytoene synthase